MLHVRVCLAVVSAPCSLVFICLERAELFAVVIVVFCHFPKYVLVHIYIKGEVGAVKLVISTIKMVLLTVPRRCFFCGSFMLFLSCSLLYFRARLFIDSLWSPAGKKLTSWLSLAMSNCEVVTLPLVSWVVLDCIDY